MSDDIDDLMRQARMGATRTPEAQAANQDDALVTPEQIERMRVASLKAKEVSATVGSAAVTLIKDSKRRVETWWLTRGMGREEKRALKASVLEVTNDLVPPTPTGTPKRAMTEAEAAAHWAAVGRAADDYPAARYADPTIDAPPSSLDEVRSADAPAEARRTFVPAPVRRSITRREKWMLAGSLAVFAMLATAYVVVDRPLPKVGARSTAPLPQSLEPTKATPAPTPVLIEDEVATAAVVVPEPVPTEPVVVPEPTPAPLQAAKEPEAVVEKATKAQATKAPAPKPKPKAVATKPKATPNPEEKRQGQDAWQDKAMRDIDEFAKQLE